MAATLDGIAFMVLGLMFIISSTTIWLVRKRLRPPFWRSLRLLVGSLLCDVGLLLTLAPLWLPIVQIERDSARQVPFWQSSVPVGIALLVGSLILLGLVSVICFRTIWSLHIRVRSAR